MRQTRTRVVAHRTSRYWPGERDGFRAAIESRVHRNGPPEDHAPGSRRLPGRPRPEASATRLAPGDPVITALLEAALQCRERAPDGLVPSPWARTASWYALVNASCASWPERRSVPGRPSP